MQKGRESPYSLLSMFVSVGISKEKVVPVFEGIMKDVLSVQKINKKESVINHY